MPLVWVTGISGAGKSSVAAALSVLGYQAFDADRDGFSAWRDRSTGVTVEAPPSHERPGWVHRHAWVLDRDRVEKLATMAEHDQVFLCGSVENETDVWDLFDRVVCLVIDETTLRHRLATRTGNDFGKSAEELELVLGWNLSMESSYRALGVTIVDATQSLENVVDAVLAASRTDRPAN